MNDDLEQIHSLLRVITQRMDALEYAMTTALNTINTLALKIQYWEVEKKLRETRKERER